MRLFHFLICTTLSVLLAACAGPGTTPFRLNIDRSIQAQGQNSRVEFVVLHYTSASNTRSLALLSGHRVSSHYLITDDATPHVYQLVDESRRAWHAGESQWYGRTWLNASSIGIEIVNAGMTGWENSDASSLSRTSDHNPTTWDTYTDAQIETLRLLLQDIVKRHDIKPENIVGHSDIAPHRKSDPGPLFPWKKLAEAGLGRWFDEALAAQHQAEFERDGLPDTAWIQGQLARVGYNAPQNGLLDAATKDVISAFQMHYRPQRYDGLPDAETLGILKSLP